MVNDDHCARLYCSVTSYIVYIVAHYILNVYIKLLKLAFNENVCCSHHLLFVKFAIVLGSIKSTMNC